MADPLVELAMATMGVNNQQSIAASNPYVLFNAPVQSFAQSLAAAPAKSSGELWRNAAAASLAGLGSGVLQGFGQDYQTTLTDRYNNVFKAAIDGQVPNGAGLPKSLFSQAVNQAALYNKVQELEAQKRMQDIGQAIMLDQAKSQNIANRNIQNAILKNPFMAKKGLEVLGQLSQQHSGTTTPPTGAAQPVEAAGDVAALPSAETSVDKPSFMPIKDPMEAYKTVLEETGDPVYARKEAEGVRAEDLKRKEVASKYLIEQRTLLNNTNQTVANLETAVNQAKETGGVTGEETLRSGKLALQDWFGNDTAEKRRAARVSLESLGLQAAGEIRRMFPGQVSDKEMALYLKAVPGTDKIQSANVELVNRMKKAGFVGQQRVRFIEKAVRAGASLDEAQTAYDSTLNAIIPLFVNGEINPDRLNLDLDSLPLPDLLSGNLNLTKKKEGQAVEVAPKGGEAFSAFKPKQQPQTTLLEDAASMGESVLSGASQFGESALFGLPSRIVAGAETIGKELGEAFTPGPGKPISQNFSESLAETRGTLEGKKRENPISSGVGELAGLFASPINKLKPVQALFKAKGAGGVLGRAAYSGVLSAAENAGEENLDDRVQNAALLSATLDVAAKGVGKLAGPMMDSFRRLTGLTAQNYREAAKGLGKTAITAAKQKFNRALGYIEKEHGISKLDLMKGDESVMQDLIVKAQGSIAKRGNEVDNIVAAADKALGGKGVLLSSTNRTKLFEDAAGGDVAALKKETQSIVEGFAEKLKQKSQKPTLAMLQKEKKALGRTYKPEQAYFDANSAVTKDFRATIEKTIGRLESAGKMPGGSLAKLKELNRQESDLMTLRNAYAKKLPGAMAQEIIQTGRQTLFTTGGAGTGGAALAGGAVGGEAGAKAAVLAALATYSKRIMRPVTKALSSGEVADFLASPEFRALGVGVENVALGQGAPIPEFFSGLGDNSITLESGDKKKTNPVTSSQGTEPMTSLPKHKLTPMIEEVANTVGVDPALLHSLAVQESSLKPEAIGPTTKYGKARGLTQVLPSTAADVARKLGLKNYNIMDPKTNLTLGATYLKELINKYGDEALALTAYHSGAARVDRLLASTKDKSLSGIMKGLGPIGKRYAQSIIKRMGENA